MRIKTFTYAVLLCGLALSAHAQNEITLNFFVNYGAAYREATWATVDVYVQNNLEDIEGALELRTYNLQGDVQSPIHRLPIVSPKQSTKRFRLHVFLQQCTRMEVQLFNGRRNVLDVPAFMQLSPIAKEDYLCLILDDAPENYGFLSTALFQGQKVRFFRESLGTEQLNQLADRLQCYEPFDLIVLGDIDPQRIGAQHRELLMQYVERGGTLVACTGDNAARYKGSWLEDFAGVRISDSRLMKGEELAAEVFDGLDAEGGLPTRETLVPALEPTKDGVQRLGHTTTLATLRKVGAGHVTVIAVDANSLILQMCIGYLNLWRDLAKKSLDGAVLNIAEGVMLSAASLPRVAGVELAPVSSVITYLGTYFIVAIVLNWLFWNFMKRREMAWICLVLFSIGFTAYAMVFGTQGRARYTELEQIEILQLNAGSATAEYTGFTGILAKGTGTFEAVLRRPNALLYEPKVEQSQYQPYARIGMNRPVTYIQEEPGRFADLRVGASEMRLVVSSDYVPLKGGISGSVAIEKGKVSGELVNNTGLAVRKALLLVKGKFYKLPAGNNWNLQGAQPAARLNNTEESYYYPGYYDPYSNPISSLDDYEDQLLQSLLREHDAQNNMAYIPEDMPPLVIAWAQEEPLGGYEMDISAETNLKSLMLIAEVPGTIGSDTSQMEDILLSVQMRKNFKFHPHELPSLTKNNYQNNLHDILPSNGNTDLEITHDVLLGRLGNRVLVLDIFYCNDLGFLGLYQQSRRVNGNIERSGIPEALDYFNVILTLPNGTKLSPAYSSTVELAQGDMGIVPFTWDTFEIPDWQSHFGSISSYTGANLNVSVNIAYKPGSQSRNAYFQYPVHAAARLVWKGAEPSTSSSTSEGVVAWQP